MAKPTETEPTVEPDAAEWGYCHNPECVVHAMQVFHPVGQPSPDTAGDDFGRPHMCADLTHPHPVMCQCGQLLHAEPVEGQPDVADTLAEDAG